MVVKRIMSTEPTLVIGAPPCAAFSRIQQLNLHIHGDARSQRFEEDKAEAGRLVELLHKAIQDSEVSRCLLIDGTSSVRRLVEIGLLGGLYEV